MQRSQFDDAIVALSKISAFIVEMKYRYFEIADGSSAGFDFDELRRCVKLADLQSDKKVQNRKVWTEGEYKKMPYLKDLKYRVTVDGIHQFRYRRDGFNKSFNSKNFEVAKKKAYDFIAGLKQVISDSAPRVSRGVILDDVYYSWLEIKKLHVGETTWKGYVSIYENHIRPAFGYRKVKDILPMTLQPFFTSLFQSLEKTCENAKIILSGVFEYAIANRFITTNPMKGVFVPKHYRIPGKALDEETLERFKTTMKNDPSPYGLAGLILIYSGIRGFELESMMFDWDNGTFTVKNAKLKQSQKTNPGNLFRTVPIFPALWELKDRIQNETWKINYQTLATHFKEHFLGATVKDLRHTFISKARESGIDNELVSLWTGHATGKNVTANTYTHYSMTFQKKEAKKLKPY